MTRATLLPLLASLCFVGCAQLDPPRELKLELPALITSKEPVMVHARAVQQDGTSREPSGSLDYKVTPPELASIGKGGVFTCNRSGDGTVALTLAGVEGRAKFSCKLIARLDVPAKLTLDAAAGEQDLPVKVLDSSSHELDVPVSVTSDLASVVQARSGRLVPGSVGNAKLSVRAGELAKPVEVEVVRTLKPEVLPVDQNRRISYSLDAGKYRLSVVLPAAHQLTVDWLGAPYCAYRRNAAEHQAECTLQHKGSVSFDNPAFLLRGEKTPSVEGVTLREVP